MFTTTPIQSIFHLYLAANFYLAATFQSPRVVGLYFFIVMLWLKFIFGLTLLHPNFPPKTLCLAAKLKFWYYGIEFTSTLE